MQCTPSTNLWIISTNTPTLIFFMHDHCLSLANVCATVQPFLTWSWLFTFRIIIVHMIMNVFNFHASDLPWHVCICLWSCILVFYVLRSVSKMNLFSISKFHVLLCIASILMINHASVPECHVFAFLFRSCSWFPCFKHVSNLAQYDHACASNIFWCLCFKCVLHLPYLNVHISHASVFDSLDSILCHACFYVNSMPCICFCIYNMTLLLC